MIKLMHRSLRRSFCRKRDSKVDRLIGGAGAYICDKCIGMCNRILETAPPEFADWDSLTDTQLLDSLAPPQAAAEAVGEVVRRQVDALRKRGVSWAAIGRALGISRQAAWERLS